MRNRVQPRDADCGSGHEANEVSSGGGNAIAETGSATPIEDELIRRVRSGEREVFYDLVAPYERRAYVIAFSILHNEAEAEDCVQDAVLKALRHLEQFRGESKFGSWLVRIIINEAKMRLRKLRPLLHESLDETDQDEEGEYAPRTFGDWREIPSETLEREEAREAIGGAVKSLAGIYREVFVLRDVEGHDVATTAQILGISEVAVKTRLLRARLQLKDMLTPLLRNSGLFSREPFKKGRNPWL